MANHYNNLKTDANDDIEKSENLQYTKIMEDKKLKDKFFGNNELYSKEIIAYKIKDS